MDFKADFFPGLQYQALDKQHKQPPFGVIRNASGTYAAPTVGPFAFFNEHDFFSPELLLEKCQKIAAQMHADATAYELFVRQKGRRPSYDIYAGFQPFNEAFKAFFPFIKILKKRLQAGDLILNLWDRTGWGAVLLAGLFPEQKIINIWEGDREALGYKGFHFWYGHSGVGQENLQFVFADLNQALPFADNSVGLVLGFDAFHRFDQSALLTELFRIVKTDSAILFPHVHLSNAEPEPFFERGCRQLHGKTYDAFFEQTCAASGRKGYILPEPEQFHFNELAHKKTQPIRSQPDTKHYNSMIAILPESWEQEEQLQAYRFENMDHWEDSRILVNPLLDINLHQNEVIQNPKLRADRVGYLLERHPIYLEKLAKHEQLSEQESILLYWAERLLTVNEIAQQMGLLPEDLRPNLQRLQALDILQLVPIAADHLRLQYFVSNQSYQLRPSEQTVAASWQRAVRLFGERSFIYSELDDSELSYADSNELLQVIAASLLKSGVQAGDRVAFLCSNHFEAVLSILASLQIGAVVVPIDPHLASPIRQSILAEVAPTLVFADPTYAHFLGTLPYSVVYLDEEEEPAEGLLFSEWLTEDAITSFPTIKPQQLACLLYTSGSTGIPKGVALTHAQLVNSGRLITETFHWQKESRFFSPGELDSMSGFRNHIIAPLEVGASIIIAKAAHKAHLFSLLECMATYRASILGTTPALLGQLLPFASRAQVALRSVKTIICTGSNLSPQVKLDCKEQFGLVPLNYYGLTETTGICLAEGPDHYQLEENTVGIPRSCIAQIVDEQGQVVAVGTEGYLRIYSENNMQGYYQRTDQTADLLRQGWLYTGDRALRQPSGHIALLGRTRDIIKTASGQLVFAAEIENSLRQKSELITAVAVTGIIEKGDEKITAFLIKNPKCDTSYLDIRDQLRAHIVATLGSRKTPVHWQFVNELPINSSGKVIKPELVKWFSAHTNTHE